MVRTIIKKGTAWLLLGLLFCQTMILGVSAQQTARHPFYHVVLFASLQGEENPGYFDETLPSGQTRGQSILDSFAGSSPRSLTSYMRTVSEGNVELSHVFPQYDEKTGKISVCSLPYTVAQAANGNVDYGVMQYIMENVDLSSLPVDGDGDGFIDNVSVVLIGGANNTGTQIPTLYPHENRYPAGYTWPGTGAQVGTYVMLNTDQIEQRGSGVLCHEFLHVMGLPDLYTSDGSQPVGEWDIMAVSSRYLTKPLAYLQMTVGWITLPTRTQSGTITLSASGETHPKACILQSPLNPYEYFVVEMRQKGDYRDEGALDTRIGGTGVIVYRVDTTVDGLSNYFGRTGIYVFRPQPGQNGYNVNETLCLRQAYLSDTQGRTSIGWAEWDSGLSDGALTFSDGSNSGLVIHDVTTLSDGVMQLQVDFPDASSLDLWQDTTVPQAQHAALADINGVCYAALANSRTVQLYRYENHAWQPVGDALQAAQPVGAVALTHQDGAPVVAYTDMNMTATVQVLRGTTWQKAGSLSNVSDLSIQPAAGTVVVGYVTDSTHAYVTALQNDTLQEPVQWYSGLCGTPRVAGVDGRVYLAVREATNQSLVIRSWQPGGTVETVESPSSVAVKSADVTAYAHTLYALISDSTDHLTLSAYRDGRWQTVVTQTMDSFSPRLAVAQGNLYVLSTPSRVSATDGLKVFAVEDGTFRQEGSSFVENKSARSFQLAGSGDQLFVSYEKDGLVSIRQKTVSNRLLSLTLEGPFTKSYRVGEEVSLAGLVVTANYQNGNTRVLEEGEYTVSSFSTQTVGTHLAQVHVGGVSNSFVYEVFADTPAPERQPVVFRDPSGTYGEQTVSLGDDGRVTAPTWKRTGYTLTWSRALTGLQGGEVITAVWTPVPPATPKLTGIKSTGYQSIQLSWQPVTGATGYRVYRKTAGGSWKTVATLSGSSTKTYVDKTVTCGKTYTYTVRAYRTQEGATVWSSYDKTGLKATAIPATPKLTGIKSTGYQSIQLSWQPVTGATGYRVYRKTAGGSWKTVATLSGSSTKTYVDKTATCGTAYTYTVRAYRTQNGTNVWSSYDKTGLKATAVPAAPTVRATSSGKSARLSWQAVPGASGYVVYVRSGSSWKRVSSVKGTGYTQSGLTKGRTYTYTVRAYRTVKGKNVYGAYHSSGTKVTIR